MKSLIFIIAVLLDQITKFIVSLSLLENQSLSILNNYITLIRSHNHAALLGFLSEESTLVIRVFLFTFSAVGIAMIGYTIKHKKYELPLGIVLILAGAVGNYIDRLTKGYVIDFISTPYMIFNLADLFIVIGVIFLFTNVTPFSHGV